MAKANFVGEYRCKLDEKGRMVFPSDFKEQLTLLEHKSLIIKKEPYQKSLTLYTQEAWDRKASEMRQRLNLFNKDHLALWDNFMRNRAIVTPDEKTGRILIPRHLLEKIDAVKEMVFLGADDSIILWAAEMYITSEMSDDDYAESLAKHLGDIKTL